VYGYRKVHHDPRDLGENRAENKAARLMRAEGLGAGGIGSPTAIADDQLVEAPLEPIVVIASLELTSVSELPLSAVVRCTMRRR
jgi:hypothetical protein